MKLFSLLAALLLSFTLCAAEFSESRTFAAGEAIATANLRLKLSGTSVVKAGATEFDIGTALTAAANGENLVVKLAHTGTVTMVASKIIAAGAAVYPAAAGKISDAVAGYRIGYALNASAADGDLVEVIRVPSTITFTGDLTLDADADIAATAGTGAVDFSGMTGTFATPTGAGTLSGTTNIAANKNLTCSAGTTALDLSLGTGAFKTTSGAVSINGSATVATAKTLTVTDADALVVGSKKVPQDKTITFLIPKAAAITLYDVFVAERAYTVTAIRYVPTTAQGGALTVTPVKAADGAAPAAATTPLVSAGLDGNAAAYTAQSGALTATGADLDLAAGDRIGVVLSTASTVGQGTLVITLKCK